MHDRLSRSLLQASALPAHTGFTEGSLSGGADSVFGVIQAEDILAQLDKSATEFTFPDLGHGYSYAVDARMHLFRDLERWALIVETVGYNPRMENLVDVVHIFGNCLTTGGPGFVNGDFLDRVENMGEIDDEETYYAGDAPVVVRGRPLAVDAGAHGPRQESRWPSRPASGPSPPTRSRRRSARRPGPARLTSAPTREAAAGYPSLCPTAWTQPLHKAKRSAVALGIPLRLLWDFRPHQGARP